MMHEACSEGEKSPGEAGGWEPDSWWDDLENEIVGDLAEKIPAVKDGVDLVELCAFAGEYEAIMDVGSCSLPRNDKSSSMPDT
jgi:hypothetical protein